MKIILQENRGYSYRLEKHALNALIAGPLLWLVGSILNACQVYERADGRTQILQSSVNLPFLMGSLLFLVGGFFNRHYVSGSPHPESEIMVSFHSYSSSQNLVTCHQGFCRNKL